MSQISFTRVVQIQSIGGDDGVASFANCRGYFVKRRGARFPIGGRKLQPRSARRSPDLLGVDFEVAHTQRIAQHRQRDEPPARSELKNLQPIVPRIHADDPISLIHHHAPRVG